MTSNYKAYLEHLASFADSHSLAVEAETNIYPLFADIKNLINHYKSTIEKFENIQSELISFVERLQFDENDFDYYQEKFKELRKVDGYLQELKTKQVPVSISNEIKNFIANIYSSASLYKLGNIEEEVLAYHNKAAEAGRYEQYQKEQQASTTKTIIIIVVVVLFIIFLISKCNH